MRLDSAQQRIRWLTFGVLAVTAIALTILDATGNLDAVVGFMRDPFTGVMRWTSTQAEGVSSALSGPRDLVAAREEIEVLENRVAELERTVDELREVEVQFQILQDLVNRARLTPDNRRLAASVIAQDTNLTAQSIIIDRGYNDGVRVGMPVEGARGLVGRVFRTAGNSAQVILLNDSSSAIPVRLGASRATGLLRGGGVGGATTIDWIDLKHRVAVNEEVLTSGLGGDFPPDLVVGRVIDVVRREAELFQQAVVQPAVDVTSLEAVFVITGFQAIDTDIYAAPPGN